MILRKRINWYNEDGRTISAPIGWFPRLAYGTPPERKNFQISEAGHGIHWPDLDEDVGVAGLLLGKHSMESPASWLAKGIQSRRLDGKPLNVTA